MLEEAQQELQKRNRMPPVSGDQGVDSDTEDRGDIACSDDEAIEAAGDLELNWEESDSNEEEEYEQNTMSRRRQNNSNSSPILNS